MTLYVDLLVTDDDLTLDDIGVPTHTGDRASIAQDIKHMIRETGLLIELVGQRDQGKIATNLKRIEIEVEKDVRIRPGTAKVTATNIETYFITAETMELGRVEVNL